MKRILVLNYEFPPLGGGASPVSYELAKRLSETGDFDIDVVTMRFRGLPAYQEENAHFRIHRVWSLRGKKELSHPWEMLAYLVSGYFKSASLFRKNHYDICHCHFIIPTGVIVLMLKLTFGLPYIITSHGSDVPGYNPDRFRFSHKFTKPFLRTILNNAKGAFTGSQYLADLGNKIGSRTKYKVIREGFDSSKFTPQTKTKTIVSTGRLLPRKGFQYLIQAVSDEDIGYDVHIVGDGPMMPELKTLADNSKTKIVFHGWIDNKSREYKDLLEQASIYVLVSERENSSVSLLEAMSAGCAIITASSSGSAETVGDAGMIIAARNVTALKDVIVKSIIDHVGYGENARKRLIEEYSPEKFLFNYRANLLV